MAKAILSAVGEEVKSDFNSGIWFQAACSGLWYQNHLAAGSVSNVRVDGVLYRGPEPSCWQDDEPEEEQEIECVRCNDSGRVVANDGYHEYIGNGYMPCPVCQRGLTQ